MINIGNYEFEGPYSQIEQLENQSGVYSILTRTATGTYDILDIGESEDIETRVSTHDRRECWEEHEKYGIHYAAYYCNESERIEIENELRNRYASIPCGEE